MVILALLKSDGRTPLQWWTFREAQVISVGRSLSNQVIVRDSHVSRKHFELCPVVAPKAERLSSAEGGQGSDEKPITAVTWRIVSHGKNGTYLNDRLIEEAEIRDDDTLQLAPKGPRIKVYLRNRIPRHDRLPPSKHKKIIASPPLQSPLEEASSLKSSGEVSPLPTQRPEPVAAVAIAPEREIDLSSYAHGTIPTSTIPSRLENSGPMGRSGPLSRSGSFAAHSGPIIEQEPVDQHRATPHRHSTSPDASVSQAVASSIGESACEHVGNPPSNLLCFRCGQPLRVIRTVRHYQLLRLLGQGGMGTTYLAWKLLPESQALSSVLPATSLTPGQRLVVVKQLNSDVSSIAKARELFEREAAVLQKMNHPGIPRFLDSFSEGGQSYLVMELVHGQDLEQYVIKQGAIEKNQAIQWMQQTCDVLHHLHTQHPPILHRDIKPANLLRQYRDKRIVVVDFGAVKAMAGAMGTRIKAEGYTAPEQEMGKPEIASDLYSIGATLVFLLTRKSPLDFYVSAERVNFDEAEEIPADLAQIITKTLATEASDRYSSALELKLALGTCLDIQ